MLRHIRRRGAALIAGIGLALSIAACASQAKVQEQPLLNQLMAPNGFVIQQPATNQTDMNTTLPFGRVEQAPAAAPAGESQRAMDAKQNTAVHMGCGK